MLAQSRCRQPVLSSMTAGAEQHNSFGRLMCCFLKSAKLLDSVPVLTAV